MLFSVKTLFLTSWANSAQLFSKPQTTVFSEIAEKRKKSGTPNIKDPISLFKDTRHLLLCSHKHAVSQKQMESSVLTEAACGARNTSVKRHVAS